jgi:hypothetical protein
MGTIQPLEIREKVKIILDVIGIENILKKRVTNDKKGILLWHKHLIGMPPVYFHFSNLTETGNYPNAWIDELKYEFSIERSNK